MRRATALLVAFGVSLYAQTSTAGSGYSQQSSQSADPSDLPRYTKPAEPVHVEQGSRPTYQPYNYNPYRRPAQSAPSIAVPAVIYECEGDQCTRGGGGAVWLFQGRNGQAMWHYTAVASLTVQYFDGQVIRIHREDPNPSYSSPRYADLTKRPDGVFFADYQGTVRGNRIDGTVVFNGGGSGIWYATLPTTACLPNEGCPLSADQLMQLGKNAVDARLPSSALICFYSVALQGNSEAQNLAGLMFRDGIGTRADPDTGNSLLEKSASQGNPQGELSLSQTYQDGIGVPRDADKALYWKNAAIAKIQQLRDQQAQRETAKNVGTLIIIGAIAALFAASASSHSGDSADSEESGRRDPNDYPNDGVRMKRNYDVQDWFSRGGGVQGPPSNWHAGNSIPQ